MEILYGILLEQSLGIKREALMKVFMTVITAGGTRGARAQEFPCEAQAHPPTLPPPQMQNPLQPFSHEASPSFTCPPAVPDPFGPSWSEPEKSGSSRGLEGAILLPGCRDSGGRNGGGPPSAGERLRGSTLSKPPRAVGAEHDWYDAHGHRRTTWTVPSSGRSSAWRSGRRPWAHQKGCTSSPVPLSLLHP